MAITRKQKEEILADIIEYFKEAKSVVFSQYKGATVKDMRTLRKQLHDKEVRFKVAKKTLIALAASQAGLAQLPEEFLTGPIGVAFSMQDEMAPAKIIYTFGKDHESIKITGAIFEGKLISAAEAKELAILPGKDVLLAKLVGLMKSPIAGFHNVLHSLLRNFVYVVNEVSKKPSSA